MNQLKHNKKRNVGLLNEFFARTMASSILEKKYNVIDKAKSIWSKYLTEGTELLVEQKIFDVIYTTKISDTQLANRLLENLKKIAIKQNSKKLNDEKTRLLHEINNDLGDSKFFERAVEDYKIQATIQTMINCWRESSAIGSVELIQNCSLLENQVMTYMTTPVVVEAVDSSILEYGDEEIQGLILNIMVEKFNKSYGQSLNEEQKNILNMYVFSSSDYNKKRTLLEFLEKLRVNASSLLQREYITNPNKALVEKFTKVRHLLEESSSPYRNVSEGTLSDDMITFYMTVSKITEELSEKNETAR